MANKYYFNISVDSVVVTADSLEEAYDYFNGKSLTDLPIDWEPEFCLAEDEDGNEIDIEE